MYTRTAFSIALTLGAAVGLMGTGYAQPAPTTASPSVVQEIPDPQLAAMRGRFTLGNNTIAYFGVTMMSAWTTAVGEQLHGSLTMGMHFNHAGQAPTVTFVPTMTIAHTPAVPTTGTNAVLRSVDGSGLGNVRGLVQGIQVAGDHNHAVNVTSVSVGDSGNGPPPNSGGASGAPLHAQVSSSDASIAVNVDPNQGASLTLGVAGQGLVTQWIRSGSVGQLIQLTADGQSVANQLSLDLMLKNGAADQAQQALRGAAQALMQARLNGIGR